MLQRLIVGGALVGGGFLAYNWWKKQKDTKKVKGVLQAVGITANVATSVRPGATAKVRGMTPAKIAASKVRGMTPARITASKVRLTRPGTLSECCDNLCLPTLARETRNAPALDQRINFNRNLWADYYNCNT